jgi:hypothetical protein
MSAIEHGDVSHRLLYDKAKLIAFVLSRPYSFEEISHVLLEISKFIRCSLPSEPVPDAIRTPIGATFADYVTTLPLWERHLIAHATGDFFPDSPLDQLLQQRNAARWFL